MIYSNHDLESKNKILDKVGIDSNCLTYLLQAFDSSYDPNADPDKKLAKERKVLYHLFLLIDLHVTQTVAAELAAIKKADWRTQHAELQDRLLVEVSNPAPMAVPSLTKIYLRCHNQKKDCCIIAEAKLADITVLLTFDTKLLNNKELQARVAPLRLVTPSKYWEELVEIGVERKWSPHISNPHHEDRWRWQNRVIRDK